MTQPTDKGLEAAIKRAEEERHVFDTPVLVRHIIETYITEMLSWHSAETAPKDGTHILVCSGPYDQWTTFAQRPPQVVHWYWDGAEDQGFYPSHGIVENSYNDHPVEFTHWRPLGETP